MTAGTFIRRAWTATLVLTGLVSAAAWAQGAADTAGDSELGEVVVTGTRIQRSGFEAPTPVTMITSEDIQRAAPANIADFVNSLPQVSGSSTPRVGNAGTSSGTNGLNLLNLRALGINRTLVLLDGRRIVPSTNTGAADVNNLPSALVQRVDVVTGGASAAYGSDAVAGVVNFVLDKEFTGIKADLAGGSTSRDDDRTVTATVAFGHAFAGNRGHVLLSGEYGHVQGVSGLDPNKRRWFNQCDMLSFASTVVPQRVVACGVNARFEAQGGLITSTALANTQLGLNGAPAPFVVGAPADTLFMVGGNNYTEGTAIDLDSYVKRTSLWGRGSYQLTDTITAVLEASYGTSDTSNTAAFQRYPGNGSTALTMRADNPYLDAATAARAAAAGVTTFSYGYSTYDLGKPVNNGHRTTTRLVAALDGKFGGTWQWNAYYQGGKTTTDVALTNTTINANFTLAIDATRNASGQIVCRSTLTNPTNGCVPLNIFGYGVASPAAIAYVKGVATQNLEFKQDVLSASLSGEPFDSWAGPVSVAAGGEYRKEAVTGVADATSLVNGFFTGNYKPTIGSYNVREVFGETVVPLAKGMRGLQSLDFNGAVRATKYSLAGSVTTWKAGLTYKPVGAVMLRAVRSRDIRAPNLGELYQAGATQRQDIIDRTLPTAPSVSITRITSGNTDLKPEVADTTSFGIVLRPTFLSGFNVSLDYYSIVINGAVTSPASQEIVDRCARGETSLCALIVRNSAGVMTQILGVPVNVAQQKVRGYDMEATWSHEMAALGSVQVRALATRLMDFYVFNNNVKTDSLGQNTGSTPSWRWLASLGWHRDPVSLTLTGRGFAAGVYDNTYVSGVSINDNHIPGATYFDLAGDYTFHQGTEGRKLVGYFKIENLLDLDPAIVAAASLSSQQVNPNLYDTIGRNFRVGVRLRY